MWLSPRIQRQASGAWTVFADREEKPTRDWRFLGWIALLAGIGLVLYDAGRWQFASGPLDYLLPLALVLFGVVLVSFGQRSKRSAHKLLVYEPGLGEQKPPQLFHHLDNPKALEIDALSNVVYGLIDHPLKTSPVVNVEAVALYLATADGTPIAVIDATLDKTASFRVAKELSQLLNLPLTELGKGQ